MFYLKLIFYYLSILSFSAFLISTSCYTSEKRNIYIVKTGNLAPNEYVFKKIMDSSDLKKTGVKLKIMEMEDDISDTEKRFKEIILTPSDLFVAIGSEATKFIADKKLSVPAVFTMVYETDEIGKSISSNGRMTGVFINLDMQKPISILKEISPNLKKIGTICLEGHFDNILKDLESAAHDQGIDLVKKVIKNEEDIPEAIRFLSKEIDALYLLPEHVLRERGMTKKIMLKTLSNNIFVFGESYDLVEKGALVGFGFDIREVAEATIGMIRDLLYAGEKDTAILKTRKIQSFSLFLNNRTAQKINIVFPHDIKCMAKEVID